MSPTEDNPPRRKAAAVANGDTWRKALCDCSDAGVAHVLVSVTDITGSAPRDRGAKMVVTASGVFDSIGGGELERLAIEHARSKLAAADQYAIETKKFPLAAAALQCCGGSMTLMFEVFMSPTCNVVIFGAGHVGKQLCALLSPLPIHTTLVDSREDWLCSSTAEEKVLGGDEASEIAEICRRVPKHAYSYIMTHSHLIDFEIVKHLAQRQDLRFLGLIGSETKWRNFETRLRREGLTARQLANVTCPIGSKGLTFKEPSAIAISIASDLLIKVSNTGVANGVGIMHPMATGAD